MITRRSVFVMIAGFCLSFGACSARMTHNRFAKLDWSSPTCKCVKNENGVCMTLSTHPPAYSRGSGAQFQFLPNCIDNCLPGWTLTTGPDEQTTKELARCYIDWNRLRKLNPQWSDPNWTP